jgi:polyhydroxyalkanoate synthase subunit PhaE
MYRPAPLPKQMLRCSIAALYNLRTSPEHSMFQGAEHYFKGLTDLGQQFFNTDQFFKSGQTNSWAEGLEKLMQATGLKTGGAGHEDLLERLMSQSKGYLAMLEKMYQSGGANIDFGTLGQQWLADLAKQNPFLGMNIGSMQPGAMNLGAMNPTAMFEQLLNMPAFGYSRESQERKQELLKHMLAYQKAMQAYNALSAKSVQNAIELMQSKLAARSEPGRELDSLKGLYDLWIDSLEEAFAEVAMSAEYQSAYGQLVDAQMRVRANVQKQIELATGEIGMPTRTELEGVHQKLAEVRRQLRAQSSDGVQALREEIAQLRAEVAELKAGGSVMRTSKAVVSSLLQSAKRVVQAKPASAPTPATNKKVAAKATAKPKSKPAAKRR